MISLKLAENGAPEALKASKTGFRICTISLPFLSLVVVHVANFAIEVWYVSFFMLSAPKTLLYHEFLFIAECLHKLFVFLWLIPEHVKYKK